MKNYIKGIFKRVIFKSETGYIIGLFKVLETNDNDMYDFENETITFTGYFHELTLDEKYIFYGNLVDNIKYGLQYNVTEYERVMPEEKDSIIEFLSGDLFKGVGEKTAKQIVDTLGDNTLTLIEENYQNLLLVPGLKEDKALKIHDTLTKYNQSYNTIIDLNKIGFSIKDAMKIYNTYKDITMNIINDNIYNLMYDIREISFNKLEEIRKNVNIDDLDIRRVEASIIYTINNLCFNTGDTYLYYDEIYENSQRFLNNQINDILFEEAINNLEKNGNIIIEDNKYFLREYYEAETNIADKIYY